jgi:hypothetical protein
MTTVKLQISKFQAKKSGHVDFNVLGQFVKRVKSYLHVSVMNVCNTSSVDITHGLF